MTIQTKPTGEREALLKLSAMCAKAEHSSGEMMEKMRRWQLDDDTQKRVMEQLRTGKYVDDERFCRLFARDKARFDKWGRRKIEQALHRKGIGPDTYSPILDSIDRQEYVEALRPIIAAKRRSVKARNDYELNAKLIRYALGRGYTMDVIRECVDTDGEHGMEDGDD